MQDESSRLCARCGEPKPIRSLSLCGPCYYRRRKEQGKKAATVADCGHCGEAKAIVAKGICGKCYHVLRRVPLLEAMPDGERLERQARDYARRRAWIAEHPDKALAYQARYREEHREETRARGRRWAKANPEKTRLLVQRRRARVRDAAATLTADQWRAILAAYGHRCAYCGDQAAKLTQDHVIPLTEGGGYTIANIVPACGPCNSRKRDRAAPVPVRLLLL